MSSIGNIMNPPELDILKQLFVAVFAWCAAMWLVNWGVNYVAGILKKILRSPLEKYQKVGLYALKLKKAGMIILGLFLFGEYSSFATQEHDKFMASYKSPYQQRLEFLETHCQQIDIGYEVLNNGKITYKCPNGKEYKV